LYHNETFLKSIFLNKSAMLFTAGDSVL